MVTRLKQSRQSLAFSFSLITAILLLLYLWTLTETVSFNVNVRSGQCTAYLGERSSQIDCPDLEGGEAGILLTTTSLDQKVHHWLLNLLAPGAVLEKVTMEVEENTGELAQEFNGRDIIPGEVSTWPIPNGQSFAIQARLKRPDGGRTSILLLQPGSNDGWMFQVDTENRQAVWRRWEDGQPAAAIHGVPYQKPLLAQTQSLLRQIVGTFFGALAIIFITAIFRRAQTTVGQHFKVRPFAIHLPDHSIILTRRHSAVLQSAIFTLLIILSIFAITLWIAVDLLERMPHVQDSITYLFQAQTLARGVLWAPEPPLAEGFVQEFLTTWNGKWFGQYPPGYPALLAVGVLSGAPWLVNPLLAVLTAVLIIKLGTLFQSPSTGLLAGVLALLSPFFIFLSASLMVHAAELFWVVLLMVSWTVALRSPFRKRWAFLAGAALGMLLLTRQITAIIISVSFVSSTIILVVLAYRGAAPQKEGRRWGVQAAGLLIAVFPFILLLLGYQAILTGSPWQDPRLLSRPFDLPGFGPHIGESENAFKLQTMEEGTVKIWYTDPQQPPRGHSPARGLYNTERNLASLASTMFGWAPLLTLAFCWMPFLLGKPMKYDWVILVMLLVVVTFYIAYWTTGIMYGPRYYFAALPALLLLTARGLQTLQGRFGTTATAMVFVTLIIFSLIFYWPGALSSLRGYNFISGQEKSLVEEQIEEPALVFIPVNDWWDYGRFFSGNTPWLDSPIIYARDLGEEKNACLLQAFPQRAAYLWQPESKKVTTLSLASTNPLCYNFHK
jgi:hypothetical protein